MDVQGDRHLHLYGALTPGQALDLAEGHAVDWGWLAGCWRAAGLTPPDFAALARRHRVREADADDALAAALGGGPAGFAAFQARYNFVTACSRWAVGRHDRWNHETAEEIVRVVALVAARGPAEVRVLLPGGASDAWAERALDHLAAAVTANGLRLALSLSRAAPLRHWPLVARAAARHACITGIDLCGIEDEPRAQVPLAAAIATWNNSHARRLELLVPVGEQLRSVQPLTALRRVGDAVNLGADRLGHALAARLDPQAWPQPPAWERIDERRARLAWLRSLAGELGLDGAMMERDLAGLAGRDPATQVAANQFDPGLVRACQDVVLARIRQAGVTVEVCPTSNRVVSGAAVARHGIERLTDAGVRWEVGSDDPGILGTDLKTEQQLAGRKGEADPVETSGDSSSRVDPGPQESGPHPG